MRFLPSRFDLLLPLPLRRGECSTWIGLLLTICLGLAVFHPGLLLSQTARTRVNEKPRPIPVGLDAYLAWDHWADQRIGMRAYMRSTYDRRGGNDAADASHFLYQLSDDFNVALDLEGPGILVFSRYNHW